MKNGFTFIELTGVVFLFSVGILGVFSAIQYPFFYIKDSISRLTASYLAEEGIEIVRNIRDENWLNNEFWNNGLIECAECCEADYNSNSLNLCIDNPNPLKFDNLEGYNYNSGDATKFTRKITIISDISDDDHNILKVVVLIEWEEKGKSHRVKIQENLYNWWPY